MKMHSFILFLIISLGVFSISMPGQDKVSDLALEGLKGKVKSVVIDSKPVSGFTEWVMNDKTKNLYQEFYDEQGFLTETINEASGSKLVYSNIDGFKTFISVPLQVKENDRPSFKVMETEREPIEPNERLTSPDERFDLKYVYEMDKNGRVAFERQYRNNGELFRKISNEYNKNDLVSNKTEEVSSAVRTYSYKYDNKGNVIEVNETRKLKVPGSDGRIRKLYTEYKFDPMGNWIERKVTEHYVSEGNPKYNISSSTGTLVSIVYRTITYY